jgi:hypothetical protein
MLRLSLPALSLTLTRPDGAAGAAAELPSGCELLKLPAGAAAGTDEQRGCFGDWKDEKRLLRHGVPGCCGQPDTFCLDKPPAGLDKELWDGTCLTTSMTPTACGAMCFALGTAAADGPYTLAGVESGDQCCECQRTPSILATTVHAGTASRDWLNLLCALFGCDRVAVCDKVKNPTYPNVRAALSECSMPCSGAPSEKCGGSGYIEMCARTIIYAFSLPASRAVLSVG